MPARPPKCVPFCAQMMIHSLFPEKKLQSKEYQADKRVGSQEAFVYTLKPCLCGGRWRATEQSEAGGTGSRIRGGQLGGRGLPAAEEPLTPAAVRLPARSLPSKAFSSHPPESEHFGYVCVGISR